MIAAESLTVRRRGRALLDDVSLALQPGEVLVLLGPNGAGKTTLVDALAGTTPPDAGVVRLDGRPLASWEAAGLARRRAVLPQASRVGVALYAHELVALGRLPHGGRGGAAADRQAVAAALARAGASSFAQRWYHTLSGGEQQRVQFARALAQLAPSGDETGPRYLLLDEPTASLDPAHQHALLATARALAAEGLGVLAVLHDLNLAAQYADRVVVLAGGRVAAQGPPGTALTPRLLQLVFGIEAHRVALEDGRTALAVFA